MLTTDIDKLRTQGLSWLRKNHTTLTIEEREDVLQDSLIELVRKTPDNAGALLGKIIDRRVIDLIRAKKSRAKVEVPGGDTADLSVLSDYRGMTIEGALFASDFNRALDGLPEDERTAFILMDLRGVDSFEAGLLIGVPPSTLRNRQERAKELLREEL